MSTRKSEHPIIMQAWGVRAILKELKTQTRRTRGLDEVNADPDAWELRECAEDSGFARFVGRDNVQELADLRVPCPDSSEFDMRELELPCPYGGPGDVLWVRETYHPQCGQESHPRVPCGRYDADAEWFYGEQGDKHPGSYLVRGVCVPSIHMPRWASRITLKIKSVRVERVKDITGKDAEAEGVAVWRDSLTGKPLQRYGPIQVAAFIGSAIECFAGAWNEIHAKKGHGFHANDWVWRIEFERIKEDR